MSIANPAPFSQPMTFTVASADADGDGHNANDECDDNNPSIYPGAIEIKGNGIDEDCSGADTPLTLSDLQLQVDSCVTQRGIAQSLTAKIAANQLHDLINQVEALSGQQITSECAGELLRIAQVIREH